MSTRVLGISALVMVASVVMWGVCGCEDDVSTDEATGYFTTPYESEAREAGDLVVSAPNVLLYFDNQTTEIMARDGAPPYSWSVQYPALGRIVAEGGNSVTYERLAEGNNTVVCRDRHGDTASIALYQYSPSTNEVAAIQ